MNLNNMFPSHYLKSSDLQNRPQTLVIESCTLEPVGDEDMPKPVLAFRNTALKLVLNRTNAESIADLYGEETDAWIGQAVELYPARVPFKGKQVDAIRIRPPSRRPAVGSQRPTLPAEELAGPDDDIPF